MVVLTPCKIQKNPGCSLRERLIIHSPATKQDCPLQNDQHILLKQRQPDTHRGESQVSLCQTTKPRSVCAFWSIRLEPVTFEPGISKAECHFFLSSFHHDYQQPKNVPALNTLFADRHSVPEITVMWNQSSCLIHRVWLLLFLALTAKRVALLLWRIIQDSYKENGTWLNRVDQTYADKLDTGASVGQADGLTLWGWEMRRWQHVLCSFSAFSKGKAKDRMMMSNKTLNYPWTTSPWQ